MARLQGCVQYSLMLVDPGPFSHGGVSWHAGVPTALAEQMSEVVSKSGFGRALGNAISTNVLERLLHGVMRVTNLAAVEPEDFWARHCSRFPKREAGSRGACLSLDFHAAGMGTESLAGLEVHRREEQRSSPRGSRAGLSREDEAGSRGTNGYFETRRLGLRGAVLPTLKSKKITESCSFRICHNCTRLLGCNGESLPRAERHSCMPTGAINKLSKI